MYRLTTDPKIILRIADNAFIPTVGGNSDYAAYLKWVSQGNTPLPEIAPTPIIPTVVTMRQARLALLQIGKLNDVAAAISNLPSPNKEMAQIEWEYSSIVDREKPLVQLLAPILGLDQTALDNLFTLAASL